MQLIPLKSMNSYLYTFTSSPPKTRKPYRVSLSLLKSCQILNYSTNNEIIKFLWFNFDRVNQKTVIYQVPTNASSYNLRIVWIRVIYPLAKNQNTKKNKTNRKRKQRERIRADSIINKE